MRDTEAGPLSVGLLGPPEVSLDWQPLRFEVKKALALLCYLASEGGRHPRIELAELLWPKRDGRRARTDLRSTLARLRKTLRENDARGARFLVVDGDLLGLEPLGVELDLRRLDAAVALARAETSPGGSNASGRPETIDALEQAVGVYRGEFMGGFELEAAVEFGLWLEAARARWRGVFGELCERVSRLQAGAGRLEGAISTARLWAGSAPLEEAAHSRLVELLSAAGEGEDALLSYQNFRSTLSRELGTEPSERMVELGGRLREEAEAGSSLGAALASSAEAAAQAASELPLAGRHEEFGALVSEYHAARWGRTRVVAVAGEPGIGKTRLVSDFLRWAKAGGADVLKGSAPDGGGPPYGPVVEAIRPRIDREKSPDDLLENMWLSELSRLLPELRERYPDLPLASYGAAETDKGNLFEAIARAVEALASRAPVVLFLDDLHWADAATLEVLGYATRRWAEHGVPVLLLIASRPEDPGGGVLEGRLAALRRSLPVRNLALGPLGYDDVEGLLRRFGESPAIRPEGAGDPGARQPELERLAGRLLAETGGQPLYLVETLKALVEDGKLAIRSRLGGEYVLEVRPSLKAESALSGLLPQGVRDVILSRFSRLSPPASDLLTAGAVLGPGFALGAILGVAGVGEEEALRGLDELIGHRLLVEDGDDREGNPLHPKATYSFSHEKIRQVAYTTSGQARRSMLHRRALEVLEQGGAPAVQLAHHALAAGLARPSFTYCVAAGDDAAEVFAARDAIVHYERARDLLAAGERRPQDRIDPEIHDLEHLYVQLGRIYGMVGEWEEARAVYETMLDLARKAGDTRLEVASLNHLAIFLLQKEAAPERIKALLEEARSAAEEAGLEGALAETECNLADVLDLWEGGCERTSLLAKKALVSARALGRSDLVARVLETLARGEMLMGRLEESAALAEEGATLNRELAGRPVPQTAFSPAMGTITGNTISWRTSIRFREILCLNLLALTRALQGRLREGIAVGREAQAISREDLPGPVAAMCLWSLCKGLLDVGEYEEALGLARRGTELARKAQNTMWLAINLVNLGQAHEALLNLEEARAANEEAMRWMNEETSRVRFCALAALSGDWEEAHTHAKRAHQTGVFSNPLHSGYLHYAVEALLRGGDERIAREEDGRLAERSRGNKRGRICHLRSLAVLSEWDGDAEKAVDQLGEAERLAEEVGLPGELWQVRERIGGLHERLGEPAEAHGAYSGAARTLRDLAAKIEDEGLREGFLSAPRARRVLARS